MFRRILVSLDGSKLAEEVLPVAQDLARRLSAEVHFIQVVGLPTDLQVVGLAGEAVVDLSVLEAQLDAEVKEASDYLSRLAGEWQAGGIDARWHVVRGEPASSIVDFARSHDVDLIAMSTHGRSGLSRMVFGSVADQVMRDAGTPVLVVRPGGKAAK